MKYLVCTLITLLSIPLGFASNPDKQLPIGLQQMAEVYKQLDQFSAEILVEVYQNDGATKPLLVRNASVKKSGTDYYSTLGDKATLINERGALIIDNSQKNIFYQPAVARQKGKNQPEVEALLPKPEQFMTNYDSIVFNGTSNGLEHYIFYQSNSEIEMTNLWIDANTHLISEISFHYNEHLYSGNSKVIVQYKNSSTKPHFSAKAFSEKIYVKNTKNGWQLQDAYAGYELILNEEE